jgi:hypothetical protein
VARLREAGFTGEIKIGVKFGLIAIEIVFPQPSDKAGNIIGPAPPSVMMEDLKREPTS